MSNNYTHCINRLNAQDNKRFIACTQGNNYELVFKYSPDHYAYECYVADMSYNVNVRVQPRILVQYGYILKALNNAIAHNMSPLDIYNSIYPRREQ